MLTSLFKIEFLGFNFESEVNEITFISRLNERIKKPSPITCTYIYADKEAEEQCSSWKLIKSSFALLSIGSKELLTPKCSCLPAQKSFLNTHTGH